MIKRFSLKKKCLYCDEPARYGELCGYHYGRKKRTGDPLSKPFEKAQNKKQCLVDKCTELARTKGYCPQHYYRFKRYGDPKYSNECTKTNK